MYLKTEKIPRFDQIIPVADQVPIIFKPIWLVLAFLVNYLIIVRKI